MFKNINQRFHFFRSQEHGVVTLITALLLALLIGLMGLAIDTSYAFYVRTKMQAAADAAALGGASDMLNGGTQNNAIGIARLLAAANGFSDGEAYTSVIASIPPGLNPDGSTPSYSTNASYIRVQITQAVPLYFAPLIGFSKNWTVNANAVAGIQSSPDCLVTMSDFNMNGSDTATLNNCSAVIGGNLSVNQNAKILINGKGTTSVYNNGSIYCKSCDPAPVKRSGALPTLPTVNIPSGLSVVSDPKCSSGTCHPGIYNDPLVLDKKSSYIFSSGFYLLNRGIDTKGANVTSAPNGVTLYVAPNQTIDLSGTLTLSALAAPGCSAGSGVLIYQGPSASLPPPTMTITGLNKWNFQGIVDLPYLDLTIKSAANELNLNGSLIAHSIDLRGNVNPGVSSNPCYNFISENKVSLVQ